MTWDEIGRDSLEAAKLLREAGRHRSSVSRAYYAACSALTRRLPKDQMPKHQHVPGLVCKTFRGRFKDEQLENLAEMFRALIDARMDADYDRIKSVDAASAADALITAEAIIERLEQLP